MADWPKDDDRMIPIMQNGNTGEHYKELNKQMKSPAKVEALFCEQIEVTRKYLAAKNGGDIISDN